MAWAYRRPCDGSQLFFCSPHYAQTCFLLLLLSLHRHWLQSKLLWTAFVSCSCTQEDLLNDSPRPFNQFLVNFVFIFKCLEDSMLMKGPHLAVVEGGVLHRTCLPSCPDSVSEPSVTVVIRRSPDIIPSFLATCHWRNNWWLPKLIWWSFLNELSRLMIWSHIFWKICLKSFLPFKN